MEAGRLQPDTHGRTGEPVDVVDDRAALGLAAPLQVLLVAPVPAPKEGRLTGVHRVMENLGAGPVDHPLWRRCGGADKAGWGQAGADGQPLRLDRQAQLTRSLV